MIAAAPTVVLALAACVAFAFRKRVMVTARFSLAAIVVAFVLVGITPTDLTARLFDLDLRVSELGRLAALVLLGTIAMLVADVVLDEPAYNFFPTALVAGSVVLAVLVVSSPIVVLAVLLI